MFAVYDSNLMTAAEPGSSITETDLNAAIEAQLASFEAGNYRANNRLVLDAFKKYLEYSAELRLSRTWRLLTAVDTHSTSASASGTTMTLSLGRVSPRKRSGTLPSSERSAAGASTKSGSMRTRLDRTASRSHFCAPRRPRRTVLVE